MHLTGLHLLLTYRCTYECDHCFVHSSPRAEATMPLATALDAVQQAHRLAEILRDYEPQTRPVIGPLLRGGPAKLVRKYDLPLRGEYVDACHLCYLARQMLRARFPQDLWPPDVYGDL